MWPQLYGVPSTCGHSCMVQKHISRLQLLQNSLARAVTTTPKMEHITPVFKFLHWLKKEERIDHKIISLTYDSLHTSQPQYLGKLINIKPAHPPPLLLKYLIVHTTEPLLSSGIIYQNLCELSLTRHLILQPLVNIHLYYSHFLIPNFVHISKHTFSASRTHLSLLSCSD